MSSMNSFLSNASKKISQAGENARKASISKLNHATSAMGLTVSEDKFRKSVEIPIRHSGKVWKRQGGLLNGKIASNIIASSWDERHLELRGSTLIYYDLQTQQDQISLVNKAPRGILDIREEHATVQASLGHTSGGAPSPFCISIKVTVGLAQETKWKLCFEKHSEQIKWLDLLSQVIVESSVDAYNHALLQAANPKNPKASELLQWVKSPPAAPADENDMDTSGGGHGLWMLVGEECGVATDGATNVSSQNEITLSLEMEKEVNELRDEVNHLKDSLQKSEQALDDKSASNEALASDIKKLQKACDANEASASKTRAEFDASLLHANTALASIRQDIATARDKEESEKAELNAKLQSTISSMKDQLEQKEKYHQVVLQNSVSEIKEELNDAKNRAEVEKKDLTAKFEAAEKLLREELGKKSDQEKAFLEAKADQEKSLLNATMAMLSMQDELKAVKLQASSEKVQIQSSFNTTIESLRRELIEKEVSYRESIRALKDELNLTTQTSSRETLSTTGGDGSDDEFQDCVM
eukprot:CAMPEP_0194210052 /NCGR_PEP_ID=MMETSP0156-20130528/7973_1 /TAXON_ID=33649 /ORGANISM="Thalassionema nitzschioides, Strain L26-B" /LENGTH=528 /DNA_ID=CAMNT_0038937337 /DNA_START=101 /DNA_END=1687 /DNA_ORIENTATION=-